MRPIDADAMKKYYRWYMHDNPKDCVYALPSEREFFDKIVDAQPTIEAKTTGWISVKERLPDTVCNYLVVTDEGHTYVATFTGARWYISYNGNYIRDGEVKYWMPLPEPPEVE